MDRSYEYNKNYYDWTVKCLKEDDKYEELAFFMLGVDLMIRQSELMALTFDQLEFPFVKNIKIMKATLNDKKYEARIINVETYEVVRGLQDTGKTKIFDKPSSYYIDSIQKSNGDRYFNGHIMRGIGLSMRLEAIAISDC